MKFRFIKINIRAYQKSEKIFEQSVAFKKI